MGWPCELTQLTGNRHLYEVATVIEAVRRRSDTPIGYRLARLADEPPVRRLPDPSKTAPLSLGEDGTIVDLAEN
ncbi:hypothetical protein [Streptomyces sp. CA-132043]|uniref:hypothetical protein n=1 Tax=Streptomyces sp. CA-132043 TaxID=3240048 RepID=UPI003D8FBF54